MAAERPEFVGDTPDISPEVYDAPDLPTPDETGVPDTPGFDPETAEQFPRSYVEELRRENAKYRSRARDYDQAFEGYDDESRQALLTYVQLTARANAGDTQAQAELDAWLGADEPDEAPQGDFSQMTAEEYMALVRETAREEAQRLVAERDAYQSQQAAVDGVRHSAEQLGYQYGSPDYMLLLKFANELDPDEHPDLLAAANEQVHAYHRSIIEAQQEQYLAEKEAQTLAAPRIAGTGTSPNLAAGPPDGWASARDRLHERLQNQHG